MYWLAEICVRRPVFALMIILALVVAGIASFPQLGVDRLPSMDMTTIYVRTVYPGAACSRCHLRAARPAAVERRASGYAFGLRDNRDGRRPRPSSLDGSGEFPTFLVRSSGLTRIKEVGDIEVAVIYC